MNFIVIWIYLVYEYINRAIVTDAFNKCTGAEKYEFCLITLFHEDCYGKLYKGGKLWAEILT